MRKLLLLLFALLTFVTGEVWADVLPTAAVGTYAFQATTLTTGASGHTISKNGDNDVIISANNSGNLGDYTVSGTKNYLTCTLVVKINVPSTTSAGVLCHFCQTSSNFTSAQGLYMDAERKLTTSWGTGSRKSNADETQLAAGEHTIIYTASTGGAKVYIDGTTTTLTDTGLKGGDTYYTVIRIPAAYAQYITEVHLFNSVQNTTNISSIVTECSNHMHASQQSGTTANVASGKTLILDKAVSWTSLTGTGTVLQEVNIATTVAGNLPALTLKATAGTLTYTGTSLNGTTLDGVILGGSARINTSNTVNIKNLAGNNISGTNGYAFVGSGTLNFYGTCDLTKQSDGETANSNCNVGYGSSNYIYIKEDANVTTGAVFNTTTSNNNAYITVESGATLNATDQIRSIQLTNNGTINSTSYIVVYADKTSTNNGSITATQFWGPITLAEGSTTTLSDASPFNSGAVTVSGDATLNLTNATPTLSQAITVASGKTLTIDGGESNESLTLSSLTNNGTVNFKNVTITLNRSERDLSGYTFTDCTATLQFSETGDEYKAGGFTITNIPAGVTIKVKKYGTTEYETVTPVDGTVTISHSVGVSGTAAWLDYTFNMSTIESNTHDPADQVIVNAGNAGSGNSEKLTIDTNYDTDNSYNDDGTLKVMSTPWRDITWPTNYTVAVAGNVPDVENGCLVAFGSVNGTGHYLAIIRGESQNEIKLVKGYTKDNAYEVISTMTASNATALSHLVVFTKNGNTFTVYLDGVQKAQVEYSETLGGGLQVGSIHGGVGSTGVVRVAAMDAAVKEKVFAKAIRVYDYVISDAQMAQLTDEFPYVSYGGTYSRTISGNCNLSATDTWLNKGLQDYVDVPTNAVKDAVTYYPDVEITTTAASTLTVNADMDAENITFDGTGKLTIVSDGSHNIHIYGSVTANGPVSVNYDEIDLTALPVTIGESGSIEFDFSDHDFSSVVDSTVYHVTGNTSNYGSKVTGVYPDDEDHTFSLAYNNTTKIYDLTVGPSVTLKQKQAIALVTPYQNANQIGTGVGKYTISLGEASYSSFVAFGTAVMEWETLEDCVVPTLVINQPETGKYYRFHIGDNYMCNVANNEHVRTATTTSNDASTIFYLKENNYLIAYADGYGFNFGYCKALSPGIFNSFDFSESSTKGKYLVHSNPGTESNQYSSRYITISESSLAEGQGEWTISEVTSLPVTIKSTVEWATFYSPVALTIPDMSGLKVYYVSDVSGHTATLTEIEGTIPAETAVLINYDGLETDAVANFAIGETDETIDDNLLEGTDVAISVDDDEMYTLQLGAVGSNYAGLPGLYPKTEGTLAGYKAYLPVSAFDEDVNGVKGLVFTFNDATGITRTLQSQGSSDYYNLAGQRVQQPSKGIYIVNGKKVLMK